MPELLQRPLAAADLEQVMAVERRAYPHPWSLHNFESCLRMGYHSQSLWENSTLLAYGVLSTGAGEGHLLNLCVDPPHQRRGHALVLLDALMVYASQQQLETVFLEVRSSNTKARQLYERYGFNELAIRERYYPKTESGQREDAVVMAFMPVA